MLNKAVLQWKACDGFSCAGKALQCAKDFRWLNDQPNGIIFCYEDVEVLVVLLKTRSFEGLQKGYESLGKHRSTTLMLTGMCQTSPLGECDTCPHLDLSTQAFPMIIWIVSHSAFKQTQLSGMRCEGQGLGSISQ